MLSDIFSASGHVSIAPSGVSDQLKDRMRSLIPKSGWVSICEGDEAMGTRVSGCAR
jgi:hypothetical protein